MLEQNSEMRKRWPTETFRTLIIIINSIIDFASLLNDTESDSVCYHFIYLNILCHGILWIYISEAIEKFVEFK